MVRDIGDFIAHAEIRDKGYMRECIAHVKAVDNLEWRIQSKQGLSLTEFLDAMRGKAFLANPAMVKKKLGFQKGSVNKILSRIIATLEKGEFDRNFPDRLTKKEKKVFDFYSGSIPLDPMYDQDRFVKQLGRQLVKFRIMKGSDFPRFLMIGHRLAAFAMTKMHLTTIKLSEDDIALFLGEFSYTDERMCVWGNYKLMYGELKI